MATETGFSEANSSATNARQGMVTFKSNLTPATRGSNKRKRGNNDQNLADSKRANANAFAQLPSDGGTAPTASMGDPHSDNLFAQQSATGSDDQSAQHFDLSALQAHTQSASTPGAGTASSMDTATAAAALSQHYSMQIPPHPAETFMNEPTPGTSEQAYSNLDNAQEYHGPDSGDGSPGGASGKPAVGSDEWNKQRKENHKEVERRRRETINEGINELAKIVPNCEKNKGSILARAVAYITKLHEDASQNIDKWTFEKLVTEQALTDLSGKLQRAWAEKEAWKRAAKDAGIDVENYDLGLEGDEGDGVPDTSNGVGKNGDSQRDDQLSRQRQDDGDVEA